ncbi:MAG TPA: catalase [Verrucomicrobiae bacterium]|jgi:catalase|nr:catalase [Verrucomicrobiae bacterium]
MEGLITIQSDFGPAETLGQLEAEINARGLTVFARVNHSALAEQAGLVLWPTEVILFGNPRGGTPLMQANQTIGIDLPLKALVWQDVAGKTWLSYNDPAWLAHRHGIEGAERVVATLSHALSEIAAKAVKDAQPVPGSAAVPEATQKASSIITTSTNPDQSPKTSSIPRLILIAVIIIGVAGLFAYAGDWLTPHALTPKRIADTFEQVNGGPHPGFRRNHAKGVDVTGHFDSNGQGVSFSKASIFQPGQVPVLGRFSLPGGQPYTDDASSPVRGLGIRFQLPNGEEWRTAMINLPVFPVRTPQAFYEQLLTTAPDSATGKPDPAKMQMFLAKYPESAKAFQLIHTQLKPSGFESTTFNSLNAFHFENATGAITSVRWSFVPGASSGPVNTADVGQTNKNQLFDSLIASIHRHPLQWKLIITIAQPSDAIDDATVPWPPDRRQVEVGTLTIDGIESDDVGTARAINFDPLVLPSGIASSDDPLLSARSAVYSQSFTRREGEHKNPSAISPAETKK